MTRNWWTTRSGERTRRMSATLRLRWGLAGDGVAAPAALGSPPSEAGGWRRSPDQTVEALKEEVLLIYGLLTNMMERFLSQRRALMDRPALWSIEAFSSRLSSPALAPALFCVSLSSRFLFINVSLTAFSFWFPLDLYLIFYFFSSFAFLFWCGLDCVCFWSHEFSVSETSLSPLPVLSFDLMVFVFPFRVYCSLMSRVSPLSRGSVGASAIEINVELWIGFFFFLLCVESMMTCMYDVIPLFECFRQGEVSGDGCSGIVCRLSRIWFSVCVAFPSHNAPLSKYIKQDRNW